MPIHVSGKRIFIGFAIISEAGLTGTFKAQPLLRMCQAMSATVTLNHFLDIVRCKTTIFLYLPANDLVSICIFTEFYDLCSENTIAIGPCEFAPGALFQPEHIVAVFPVGHRVTQTEFRHFDRKSLFACPKPVSFPECPRSG